MKLLVDRIGQAPEAHRFEAPKAWWDTVRAQDEGALVQLEPFVFALTAQKTGNQIVVEGGLESAIEAECSRCTARYRHGLREAYRLVLDPVGERTPADPEGARHLARDGMCLGEEIEAGWYRGPELSLGTFFAEVAALALPVQPLCNEDCPGLCSRCGAQRARERCDCVAEERPESPFAVLAALKTAETEPKSH